MIWTRTPLRLSLAGGGTDLPSFYREFGGAVLSAAITKYVYVGIHKNFYPGYRLRYSETEESATREAIQHRLTREALIASGFEDEIELVSLADVPSGTGLGSSGSFLVGLLHALHHDRGEPVTPTFLAETAVDIEMKRLGEPVGKQDQYSAAFGGFLCQEYHADDTVRISRPSISPESVAELEKSLMLFFVGSTRPSATLLEDQRQRSIAGDQEMIRSLRFVQQLGVEIRTALESGRIHDFGSLMHEHWLRKRERSAGMSNDHVDAAYEQARTHGGASGGKLVGAGGGGFLLLQTHDRPRLRKAMRITGMKEMDFKFEARGSVVQAF